MIGATIIAIALGGFTSLRPFLVREAVDAAVELNGDSMIQWVTYLIGALFIEALMQLTFIYATNDLGQRVIRDIRVKLFGHVLKFKHQFFDKTPVGQLVTRTVSDVETIANIFSEGLLVIFGEIFKLLVMLFAMFFMFDAYLVLIILSVVPVIFFATRWFQRSIKSAFTDVRNAVANLNAFVQERLTGMGIVQLFSREKTEAEAFEKINHTHRDANIRSIWYFSLFFPIIDMLSAVSIGLAIAFGGYRAINYGDVTVGDLTAIILFINMLYRPLRQLADRFNTLQMGMVAGDRVLKLIDNAEDEERVGGDIIPELHGEIVLDDLRFAYLPDEPVLKGLNLTIAQGQTVALVGATGSGKSTLVHLLLGLYEPTSGDIRIDGASLTDLDLNELRQHMAIVQQDVFLFSDSVRNNITMYQPMEDEQIWEASRAMGIESFLKGLPGQLDYDVKERGGMLSTGQRQLLAFLRAYLTQPAMLILDEATSSIDSQAEEWIQRATASITQNRTSIIVAHRLATVLKADQIIVLDKGQIVEKGSHSELLAQGGHYANLYEKQFAEQDLAS